MMMPRTVSISLLCIALSACATHVAPRDADGNPLLQRANELAPGNAANIAPRKLGLDDIAAMAAAGRSDGEIVTRMRATGTRLAMDEAQQRALRDLGVRQSTIDALVAAEREAQRVDTLTAEADRDATRRRQEDARREWYRRYDPYPYPYSYPYPYWGGWHPYFGYSRFGDFRGWHGGIGWGW